MGRRHVDYIQSGPASSAVAIVDITPQAERFARDQGIAYFTDYERMLDTAKPDGVVLATPNTLHVPMALAALAVSWLSVALGMVPRDVETASNLPMFLVLLPFLSSGFVPTDSMPDGLSWFAEHQPFTPLIETSSRLCFTTVYLPAFTSRSAASRPVR